MWLVGAVVLSLVFESGRSELAFSASFGEDSTLDGFVKSEDGRYSGQVVSVDDGGLKLVGANQHYGLAAPVEFATQGGSLVFQYDVTLTEGLTCGGAYVKLLEKTDSLEAASFDDKTPYVIMFGPDKCGATDKVHFIVRQQNPVSGEWLEHHLKGGPKAKSDKKAHMYTAIVRPNDALEILIDGESAFSGSLQYSLEPPLTPPTEIDDPDDVKPSDWVDEAKINDPDAKKPDDWDEDAPRKIPDESAVKPAAWEDDEPETIPDPEAARPNDWDDEEDGIWEPPLVANPKCEAAGCGVWERPMVDNPDFKGKWKPPKIENPDYKGEWAPRKIPNTHYFEAKNPAKSLPSIGAVAIEIWTTNGGIVYDNFALGDSPDDAKVFASDFYAKKAAEEEAKKKKKLEKDAKKLEKKLERGDFTAKLQLALNQAVDLAKEQPTAAAVTILGLMAAIFAFLFGAFRIKPPAPAADDDDDAARATTQQQDSAAAPDQQAADADGGDDDDDDPKPPRDD
mmetsp:Transcript_8887/g.28205  ORF Transcript_8887/g.28205 Transcript_8887/m.28205 type:complete len:509 (-) Transcript_8887:456-1982(-)